MDKPKVCILPFINLATKPDGSIRHCCYAPESFIQRNSNYAFNLGSDGIDEIWNSESAKNFRMRMLKGEQPKECQQCWTEEDSGRVSKRQKENRLYGNSNMDSIEYAKNNGGAVNNLPKTLDLRLGNACNLKCRSCGPYNSSLFASEVRSQWDQNFSGYQGFVKSHLPMKKWTETDTFWKNITTIAPNINQLYFVGGEPTIIPESTKILEYLIENNLASQVELRLNTNLVKLNPDFVKNIQKFKSVLLTASIDGHKGNIRYIRHPAEWEAIEKNLKTCLALPDNIAVNIHCTVSVMNVATIDLLYRDLQDIIDNYQKDVNFYTLPVYEPSYLHINILPKDLKALARERNEKLASSMKKYEASQLLGLLNIMDQEPSDATEKRATFKAYTQMLDRIRGEDFAKTFPELAGMIS